MQPPIRGMVFTPLHTKYYNYNITMQLGGNYGKSQYPSTTELKISHICLYKPITKNVTPQFDPLGENASFFYFLLLKYKYLSPRIHLESFIKFPGKKVILLLLQAILPLYQGNMTPQPPIGGSSDPHTMWSVVGGQYPPKRQGGLKIPHLVGVGICFILRKSRVNKVRKTLV